MDQFDPVLSPRYFWSLKNWVSGKSPETNPSLGVRTCLRTTQWPGCSTCNKISLDKSPDPSSVTGGIWHNSPVRQFTQYMWRGRGQANIPVSESVERTRTVHLLHGPHPAAPGFVCSNKACSFCGFFASLLQLK